MRCAAKLMAMCVVGGFLAVCHVTYLAGQETASKPTSVPATGVNAEPAIEKFVIPDPWTPPIGIPDPGFGIVESHKMFEGKRFSYDGAEGPYRDAGNGPYTHYVDSASPKATDSDNPFGTAEKPRMSLPTKLTPGSVVEVHGGKYGGRLTWKDIRGTKDKPIFIRGASEKDMPKIDGSISMTDISWVYLEYLDFDGGKGNCFGAEGAADHIVLRRCQFRNREYAGGGNSAIGTRAGKGQKLTDVVIFANRFENLGDWQEEKDTDFHGVNPNLWGRDSSCEQYNVWILDNYFYHVSGNGVQVNSGNWPESYKYLHHVYVGRNMFSAGRQAGFWSKQARDVIMSQNKVFNQREHGGQGGDGLGYQYGPDNLWLIFNEVWDCTFGFRQSDTGAGSESHTTYIIGNIVHDSYQGKTLHWNSPLGWGVSLWQGGCKRYVVNNTFYNVYGGIEAIMNGPVTIANNIVSTLKEPVSKPASFVAVAHPARNKVAIMDYCLFFQPKGELTFGWDKSFPSLAAFQQGTGQGKNCVTGDPLFKSVDPNAPDYLDLKADSPAIDKADSDMIENICAEFQKLYKLDIRKDFRGRPRPRGKGWDIGAMEFSEAGSDKK